MVVVGSVVGVVVVVMVVVDCVGVDVGVPPPPQSIDNQPLLLSVGWAVVVDCSGWDGTGMWDGCDDGDDDVGSCCCWLSP